MCNMGKVSAGEQKRASSSTKVKKQRKNRDNGKIRQRSRTSYNEDDDDEYMDSVLDSDVIGEFKCSKCSNVYATKGLLSQHMKVHSDSRLFCDLCYKSFSTPPNLKEHIIFFHTEDGKIQYAKKLERKRVLAITRRDKPRPYLEAQKAKTVLAKISNKIAVHTALHENAIKCDQCSARFCSTEELDVHFFKHHPTSVKKPKEELVCSFAKCLVSFKTTNELNEHLKTHRKCLICGKMFKSSTYVKKHWVRFHCKDKKEIAKVDLRKICDVVDDNDDETYIFKKSKNNQQLPTLHSKTRSRGRPPTKNKNLQQQELTTKKQISSIATTVNSLESGSNNTSTSTLTSRGLLIKSEDDSSSSSATEKLQPIVFEKIKVEITEKDLNTSMHNREMTSYDSSYIDASEHNIIDNKKVKVETT